MLNLDLPTIIFQIINFLVFFAVLYWLLFKPVMAGLQKRREERDHLQRELERERQAVAVRRAELDERLSNVEEEAANLMALAREKAEEEQVSLLQEAKQEVEQILVEAQADAYRVRSQAVDAFQTDLVDAILDVSGIVTTSQTVSTMHSSGSSASVSGNWGAQTSSVWMHSATLWASGSRRPTLSRPRR